MLTQEFLVEFVHNKKRIKQETRIKTKTHNNEAIDHTKGAKNFLTTGNHTEKTRQKHKHINDDSLSIVQSKY